MKLIDNWRQVAARSYSMWAGYATLAILIAPEVRYALTGAETNPYLVWVVAFVVATAFPALRLVDQGGLPK